MSKLRKICQCDDGVKIVSGFSYTKIIGWKSY